MLSGFFGLNIVRKALQSNQLAQDVTSQNIANANTPGFHRQRAVMTASDPISIPSLNRVAGPGQFGSGVDVQTVQQIRDDFLETRLNTEKRGLNQSQVLEQVMSQVQAVFQATQSGDLNALLDGFFKAFDALGQSPESLAARENVLATGQALARGINSAYQQLVQLREDANAQLPLQVDEVNKKLQQVASLNELIRKIEADGSQANDLRDKRDQLLSEVSQQMDISTLETPFGDKTVYINQQVLVQNNIFRPLEAVADPTDPKKFNLQFQGSAQPVTVLGGKIFANLSARDQVIPFYLGKLNELTRSVAAEVNALHSSGFGLTDNNGVAFTGDNFFTVDTLQTQTTDVSKALFDAVVQGTVALPSGTTTLTTLDALGVTAGTFTVDGQTITLTAADVTAGTAISLKEVLKRIQDATTNLTATFNDANRKIVLDKSDSSSLVVGAGGDTSNFLTTAVTGLLTANVGGIGAHVTVLSNDSGARIQVNPALFNNLRRVAAAKDSALLPGDGSNASAIAQLQNAKTMGETEKSDTFQSFYQGLVTQLGLDAQEAERQVESLQLNVQVLQNRRDAVSGVNLDEELANMVKFQQAYNASARMFRTMTEMLDVLVSLGR